MRSRVDKNQPDIVKALRQVGATVQHLHTVGHGCPDILVGYRGTNYALEIKTAVGMLTDDETIWHRNWRGQVATVHSEMEALKAIGAIR